MAFNFGENTQDPAGVENAILEQLKKTNETLERIQRDVDAIKNDVDKVARKMD